MRESEQLLYRWRVAIGNNRILKMPRPAPARPIGDSIEQDTAAHDGHVVFQKSHRAEKWGWTGLCLLLTVGAAWFTSLTFTLVLEPRFGLHLSSLWGILTAVPVFAAGLIVAGFVMVVVCVLSIVALVFIGRKWGWEKPNPA